MIYKPVPEKMKYLPDSAILQPSGPVSRSITFSHKLLSGMTYVTDSPDTALFFINVSSVEQ